MNVDRFEKIVEEGMARRKEMRERKRSDYDKGDGDRLSSFRKVAIIAKELEVDCHKPSGVATLQLILKLVRDANLKTSGRPPQNESRVDTFDDAHNYLDLKLGCEMYEEGAI